MGTRKINLVVVCGGMSAEHEVSLASAKNVIDSLDPDRYDIKVVVLGRDGRLLASGSSQRLLSTAQHGRDLGQRCSVLQVEVDVEDADTVTIVAAEQRANLIPISGDLPASAIDVILPVMHGPIGEDGSIQGLAQMVNVPVVGSGVLGSAVNMDKDVMKRLLRDAGLPIARFIAHRDGVSETPSFDDVVADLGLPFFVKPCNMGSSVGISRVTDATQYLQALHDALSFDSKILLEETISGRELECSVLGSDDPIASVVGEVVVRHECDFYSYEAKYIDENGAELRIPASLDESTAEEVRRLAIEAFNATCAEGMARVDFFLNDDNRLVVNELNTIPGFTDVSMFPMLWEASGISTTELLNRLIDDAIRRFERRARLKKRIE